MSVLDVWALWVAESMAFVVLRAYALAALRRGRR